MADMKAYRVMVGDIEHVMLLDEQDARHRSGVVGPVEEQSRPTKGRDKK